MQVHPQSLPLMLPCDEYDELSGLVLEQFAHAPTLVPEQPFRYWPTGQFAEQLLQVKPLPAVWLHDPVRYLFAPHATLLHALHSLPLL